MFILIILYDKMEELQGDSKVDGDNAFDEVMNPENLNKKRQLRMCSAKKERVIKQQYAV